MEDDYIFIIVQGFYGNRTGTEIKKEDFDYFMLGYMDRSIYPTDTSKFDRTVIRVPGSEEIVFIYNKFKEAEILEKREYYSLEGIHLPNPVVEIPELGIELYSRVIVCRMDSDGELESLEPEDHKVFLKYLAK